MSRPATFPGLGPPYSKGLAVRIDSELREEEQVLWAGRPGAPRRKNWIALALLCVAGLPFVLIAIGWLTGRTLQRQQSGEAAFGMMIIVVTVLFPCGLVALGALLWILFPRARDVAYVVTGQRALIFTRQWWKITVTSFAPENLRKLQVRDLGKDGFSIVFKEKSEFAAPSAGSTLLNEMTLDLPSHSTPASEIKLIGFLNLREYEAPLAALESLRAHTGLIFPVKLPVREDRGE